MSTRGRFAESITYVLEAVVHALLATLATVVPFRDEDCWVFGARMGTEFADNPKYLFVHVAEEHPDVRAVWVSRDRSVVRDLQSEGYEAYHVWSPRSVWLTLRAGVVVLSHSTHDVNQWFVGGATVAMLWHGVPLKTVSWDAELPDLPLLARVGLRTLYDRYHLVTVPGPDAVDPLASGLGLDPERFVVTGYPRNDALVGAFREDEPVVEGDALSWLRRLGDDRRVFVYLPTFREEGIRASERLPVEELEAVLADLDAVLVVKLHPWEDLDPGVVGGGSIRRIHALPSEVDVYPLLAEADALVTDYSSVFFDYLLLDRPVVFFPYDRADYEATRGLYFDYDAITPGPVATTDGELAEALRRALVDDPHADARADLRERFTRSGEPGARSRAVVRAIRDMQRPP